MLVRGRDYQDTRDRFRWQIPDNFNIGIDTVDRHADGSGRLALTMVDARSGIDVKGAIPDNCEADLNLRTHGRKSRIGALSVGA